MVKAMINLELEESNLKLLGEKGAIPPLIEMLSGSIIIIRLGQTSRSSCQYANKGIIAAYGGVPLVLYLMFSSRKPAFITIKCFEILEKLSSDDDEINFFIDGEGKQLELDNIITDLLALQQLPNSGHYFRKPALRALLGICKFETGLVKNAILAANGVSQILPLLDDSDSEIRETAICLLFLFSQHEPGVVGYLFRPRRLKS
ncbi:U-box domain-containing protein 43-like [Trifolium pratense]|uniref:U-box domain-containing protein 43-like n=1 Tax=Trifolium pratense TaxID=57577 RepID=A0A2K3MG26_TRIPR|nr:U-box domain-containing protein 43-like [Trifolium pratense]